jgi:flagellin
MLALSIATNVESLRANRELADTARTHTRTLQRLSSGDRITSAGDDAASLSISEKLKGSIRSYQAAQRNSQDGISIVQTAEGGMQETQNMLVRLRELSMQSASDTLGDDERGFVNAEFQHLKDEIKHIANNTVYDGQHLLNGTGQTRDFQIGIDHDASSTLSFNSETANILPSALGIMNSDISTKDGARNGLAEIDAAISHVSGNRATLGGIQSQLSSHLHNIDTHKTNLTETNSRLRDTDFSTDSSKEVSERIRQEAGTAVLAQTNDMPKAVVRLLDKA